jgi:4-hydroxy-4-methyl-2-oxoglutarate aldolase
MRTVVVTGCPRADPDVVAKLAQFGVATVHEAVGRTGYLGPGIRPVYPGSRVGGPATISWSTPRSSRAARATSSS